MSLQTDLRAINKKHGCVIFAAKMNPEGKGDVAAVSPEGVPMADILYSLAAIKFAYAQFVQDFAKQANLTEQQVLNDIAEVINASGYDLKGTG